MFARFDADLIEDMLAGEMQQEMKPISSELEMITNLQNIKQGLKADFSDAEIIKTVLLNLDFTESLISEHLGQQ